MSLTNEIWKAYPYQEEIAFKAAEILTHYGIVYLAMEERTGKSITSIRVAEQIKSINKILVITKKKALDGLVETLKKHPHDKVYILTNYHSANKVKGKFDLVILDEAHSYISGYPKTSKLWKDIYKLVRGLPIIYLSATPYAQGPQLLYHQFALSSYNPWIKFKDFYDWFKFYADRDKEGQLKLVQINAYVKAIDYTKVKAKEVIDTVKHLFVSYTRQELGFEQEPEDVLHFITLTDKVKNIYNILVENKVISFTLASTGKDYDLVCDKPAKMRWALHMLEGGTLKIGEEHIDLGNTEKVDYILSKWGDSKDIAIMYHFKADEIKLKKYFKNAGLFQGISYAEGVDLSHYRHLIIYSQDHSTAKHTQRRARQANKKRTEEIKVHYLLVKGAISHKAYKTVSKNKMNFVDTVFETI